MAELEDDELLNDSSEDSGRPSFGSRIAGIRQPSYMATPVSAPPGAAAAAPDLKPQLDMSKMPDVVKMLTSSPSSIPVPPTGVNNQNLADLAKKQAAVSSPINPVDEATGKTKSQYRMGLGSRIAGALADFGAGFSGQKPSVYIGPGATNARYDRDEAQRQGQLQGINTQIGTQEKLNDENERMYRDATRQAYEAQVGEARLGTSKAQQDTADVKQQLADLKANQKPVNKIGEAANERTALADQMGLKGQERRDYILTGKMPSDREPRQPSELETWMAAFKRDNGRPPTADEISNRKSRTSSKSDQIEKDKDNALQKAEAKATDRISKLKAPDPKDAVAFSKYLKNPEAFHEPQKQAIYADLEKEKAQIQKEYETRAAQNASASGRAPAARPGAAPAKASPKIDPNNLPKQVMVGNKLRTVAGYNKTTGKVILAPEGQ